MVAPQVRLDRRKAGDRFEDAFRARKAEGIAALIAPSPIAYGNIRVAGIHGRHNVRQQKTGEPIAALVASYEQYGQMWRNLKRGLPVEMELNAQNRWVTDDSLGYNTLAELPGTDKADEYVMFGGHLDSWHAGTGATDNASSVAVAMEAMRILKVLDVGIPGFTFLQDPLEYTTRSHHSGADTYERLIADDLKQSATVLAWTAYTLANRDDLFPRKPPV